MEQHNVADSQMMQELLRSDAAMLTASKRPLRITTFTSTRQAIGLVTMQVLLLDISPLHPPQNTATNIRRICPQTYIYIYIYQLGQGYLKRNTCTTGLVSLLHGHLQIT